MEYDTVFDRRTRQIRRDMRENRAKKKKKKKKFETESLQVVDHCSDSKKYSITGRGDRERMSNF